MRNKKKFSNDVTIFYYLRWLTIILSVSLISCSPKQNSVLFLGVTTTLEDSGLLTLIVEEFNQHINKLQHSTTNHQPILIKPIVVGSGQLFTLIERGDIDIAISHEAKGEKILLDKGYIKKRIPLFYNHFLLVGENNDPAHIRSSLTMDEAFKKILHSSNVFISRGDNSGTHQFEEKIRKNINVIPSERQLVTTGTGMGATLSVAANRNAYTLVDLGTWLNFNNKQKLTALFPNQHTEYAEELKQQDLKNQYSLLLLNPERIKTHNPALAKQFEEWILNPKTLALIQQYRINNKTAFLLNNLNELMNKSM